MMIRELQKEDYDKKYLELLKELTIVKELSREDFNETLENINKLPNHKIFVIEIDNIIVASITLLIEYKFIRNRMNVGHIEDVVVKKEYRGKGLSRKLIEYCIKYSINKNCYKIILNCDEKLKKYYEKFNFTIKNVEMSFYIHSLVT
jgi:glucosamine-phosphate N-acetyltransferase